MYGGTGVPQDILVACRYEPGISYVPCGCGCYTSPLQYVAWPQLHPVASRLYLQRSQRTPNAERMLSDAVVLGASRHECRRHPRPQMLAARRRGLYIAGGYQLVRERRHYAHHMHSPVLVDSHEAPGNFSLLRRIEHPGSKCILCTTLVCSDFFIYLTVKDLMRLS